MIRWVTWKFSNQLNGRRMCLLSRGITVTLLSELTAPCSRYSCMVLPGILGSVLVDSSIINECMTFSKGSF